MNTQQVILLVLLSFLLGFSSFADARILKSITIASPRWEMSSIANHSVVPANPHKYVLVEAAPVSVVEMKKINSFSSEAEDFSTNIKKDSMVSYPMDHSPGIGHGSPP
ncbi:hypothetical protein SUGI_0700680 [Cryptomeria japonica]|nr:hypothetical protein SUGI_0700680 [Cryptomeria japonica]